MKRIIALTVCLCLAAALIGCGAGGPASSEESSEVPSASAVSEESGEGGSQGWLPDELPVPSELPTEAQPETEPEAEEPQASLSEEALSSDAEAEAEPEAREEAPEEASAAEEAPEEGALSANEITGGAALEEAEPILTNTRYFVRKTDKALWFSFTTGEQEGEEYTVTVENLSRDGGDGIQACVYEADGSAVAPTKRNNDFYSFGMDTPFCYADQDGTANSGMVDTLTPNTVYYLKVYYGKGDLLLTVTGPSDEAEDGGVTGVVNNVDDSVLQDGAIVPGESQSAALYVPLETTVFGSSTGDYAFLAFTTTEKGNESYYITVVNCSVDSKPILACMYDRFGNSISPTERNNDDNPLYHATPFCYAKEDGTANTGMTDALSPQTTYYIRLEMDGPTDFAFRISTEDEDSDRVETSSVFEAARKPLEETDDFYAGKNQTAATMIRTNTRYYGTITDGTDWVAFTTDETRSLSYTITAQKLSDSTNQVHVCLINDLGVAAVPAERQNSYYAYDADTPFCYASSDEEDSGVSEPLEPNTTYYIRINGDSGTDYMIMIGEPEEDAADKSEETESVFEVPFELNETQVQFVGNEATFIDPDKAREALAPVAEIILAHPGHPILIAGTTATVGKQEECLELSDQRAEAVKGLLVDEFGVPADQLITIGLGFEADPFVRGQDQDAYGNQIESEAAKNRRVVVLDAESDIGRSILGN